MPTVTASTWHQVNEYRYHPEAAEGGLMNRDRIMRARVEFKDAAGRSLGGMNTVMTGQPSEWMVPPGTVVVRLEPETAASCEKRQS